MVTIAPFFGFEHLLYARDSNMCFAYFTHLNPLTNCMS